MPKFVIMYSAPAMAYATQTIEAESLEDAERIAHEMRDQDKPMDDEFRDAEIMDRRDIATVYVQAAKD